MKKYENKLIEDYIQGNDIEGYNIEDLENDYEFMINVIEETNDKKMYNFCSDNLKKDYRLVKYLINKYNYDLDYIKNIADNFLDNVESELERIEICLIMDKYMSREEPNNPYKVILAAVYQTKRVEIELYKHTSNDDFANNEIGMGFLLMYDLYNESTLVTDFFAEKTIIAILSENEINLEEHLHSKFKTFEDIEKYGINNYLIQFISVYDSMLSSYISTKPYLLKSLISQIKYIKLNWENYNIKEEFIMYNTLLNEVNKYMEEHEFECILTEIEMVYLVAKKLGISSKIKEYDRLDDEIYKELMESLDYIDEKTLMLNDRIHINKVREIMLNCLDRNYPEESYEDNNTNNKTERKCKVLKFIPKNNNN